MAKVRARYARSVERPGVWARLTAPIANVEGRIRFIHLRGHIETEDLLTGRQIAAYDRLRGYAGAGRGHENDQEHGG
jgi:hypothetical protein